MKKEDLARLWLMYVQDESAAANSRVMEPHSEQLDISRNAAIEAAKRNLDDEQAKLDAAKYLLDHQHDASVTDDDVARANVIKAQTDFILY